MSDNDEGKPVPRITFIIRKNDEMTPEQETEMRNRLVELMKMYAEDPNALGGLPLGQKTKRRKKAVFQPFPTVANPANNREELD